MDSLYLLIRALYIGLFTGMVIAIPMGPAGLESMRWTVTKGLKKGLLVAAGSLIADAADVMFINFGLLNLIETDKLVEVFFWMLSGSVIFFIGYKSAIVSRKSDPFHMESHHESKKIASRPLLTGFVINFTNPMTHFFWLTLSSTVIRVWRNTGGLTYFVFAVSMLSGMFLSLFGINYLASKGRNIKAPKLSGKLNLWLSYGISIIGVGFVVYGLYILYQYLTIGGSQ